MSTTVSRPARWALVAALSVIAAFARPAAAAEPVWLTVLGDPLDAKADTVQVDVTSAVAFDNSRLVRIRANRAERRVASDGAFFRSYTSQVLIDCSARTARHRSQVLYEAPLWSGASRALTYADDDVRTMAFKGMDANPKDRIIRAACSIDLVESAKPATP
jgi:hypothetical protein